MKRYKVRISGTGIVWGTFKIEVSTSYGILWQIVTKAYKSLDKWREPSYWDLTFPTEVEATNFAKFHLSNIDDYQKYKNKVLLEHQTNMKTWRDAGYDENYKKSII